MIIEVNIHIVLRDQTSWKSNQSATQKTCLDFYSIKDKKTDGGNSMSLAQ